MRDFTKPYLVISDQIALLRRRGMLITDELRVTPYLERIGYYRLSGYWRPFQAPPTAPPSTAVGGSVAGEHIFQPDVKFSQVIDLYVFDKKLRLLLLDGIERIEVALRSDISLLLGKLSPVAHRDNRYLHSKFAVRAVAPKKITEHHEWLAKLDKSTKRSGEEFTKHFNDKYHPHLPLWMAVELWDFGMLSVFLAGMRYQDQEVIAKSYALPRPELLTSWVRSISLVRNICAHHGRLWNRAIVHQPKPPRSGEISLLEHIAHDLHAQRRLYSVAAAVRYLLRRINPKTSWGERLANLMDTFPVAPGISTEQMGFPKPWQNHSLWP